MNRGVLRAMGWFGLALGVAGLVWACKRERSGPTETADRKAGPTSSTGTTTASTAAVATAKAEPVSEIAKRFVIWLSKGETAKGHALFDEEMRKAMSEEQLSQLWAGLEGQLGGYVSQLKTSEQAHEQYVAVRVTCQFQRDLVDVRVVFDAERHIAGLQLRPAEGMEQLRPQTPKPPFPYTEREASYTNAKDGAVFAGTLTIPAGKGPHPVVVLLTGSGSQDRDETVFGHKPFLIIADHLSRSGFAVLRVDDRGAGKTKGDAKGTTLELHATDAEAAIDWLKKQPEIDPKRIGLIGHSEGGIIAAMVASGSKDVAFLVSIAGPGVSGAELNPMQIEAILRAQGSSDSAVAAIVAEQKKIMKLVVEGASDADVEQAVRTALTVAEQHVPEAKKAAAGRPDQQLSLQVAVLKSPWFRSFVKLDARQRWRKVRCPVLALIGAKDTQVPADVNLAEIDKALRAGGNKDVTTTKLDGLNHLLQTASTGLLEEYATIQETISPAALTLMTTWLTERAKLGGGAHH